MKRKTIIIELSKGQYISQLEPFKSTGIPNNSIIHKTVTGCGITTFAIQHAKHHSIIILPNVPVIKDKVAKHNAEFPSNPVIGVHKDISVDDIRNYLTKVVQYKKILTTPEGFVTKVLKVFEDDYETLINTYFLVYDECERIVTDVSYRGAMAAPFDIFFDFKYKAMVSATTLPYSGELLQGFDHYIIKPTYDYSKPIELITTNNVLASLITYLSKLQSEQVCIFFNSTEGINMVMTELKIKSDSRVFCAQRSVGKLLAMKFKEASSDFTIDGMKKYNLFTSRYFSAFDINLDTKPDVIILSDLFTAEHSIIDPKTEVIQIAGRFRNGINSLTHIANCNPKLSVMAQEDGLNYINGSLDLHEKMIELLQGSKEKENIDMLNFMKQSSPMADFFVNGKRNPFMIDNALNDERVKGYYQYAKQLFEAYNEVTDHFEIAYANEEYPASDASLHKLRSTQSKRDQIKEAARIIDQLLPKPGHFNITLPYIEEIKKILIELYPYIPEALTLIGLDELDKTNYVKSEIDKAVKIARRKKEDLRIAPFFQSAFAGKDVIDETELIDTLTKVAETNNYNYPIRCSLTKIFFSDTKRSTKGGSNVWKLGAPIDFDPIQES